MYYDWKNSPLTKDSRLPGEVAVPSFGNIDLQIPEFGRKGLKNWGVRVCLHAIGSKGGSSGGLL